MIAASCAEVPVGFSVPSTKPEQVTLVEVLEAVHLVDDVDRARQSVHDLRRELEAQIHPPGADVEQQVAGRARGVVPRAVQLAERVQARRPRPEREAVPRLGTDRRPPCAARRPGCGNRPSARCPGRRTAGRGRCPRHPARTVRTRKIAASVRGVRIGWGCGIIRFSPGRALRGSAGCRRVNRGPGRRVIWLGRGGPDPSRAISSAGEHCLHTAGVTGSIPVSPTLGAPEPLAATAGRAACMPGSCVT